MDENGDIVGNVLRIQQRKLHLVEGGTVGVPSEGCLVGTQSKRPAERAERAAEIIGTDIITGLCGNEVPFWIGKFL